MTGHVAKRDIVPSIELSSLRSQLEYGNTGMME